MILTENYLFCYTNHKKTKITEVINLRVFEKALVSENEIAEFELLPKDKQKTTRIFSAESMDDADEQVYTVKYSIDPAKQQQNADENQYENKQNNKET